MEKQEISKKLYGLFKVGYSLTTETEKYKIALYPQIDGKLSVSVWAKNGMVNICEGEKEDSCSNIKEKIVEAISNYEKGFIHCSDCGKLIPLDEVAGHYFAGSYCEHCWESKWKAIEEKETYN